MLKKVKEIIKNNIGHFTRSYSQEGEDMVLKRIFGLKDKGFFVDIGSHHPKRFSNTYLFYKHGWRGINIDAMPGTKRLFDKYRPHDINIECAISDEPKDITYYQFTDHAFNTIDKEVAEYRVENYSTELIGTVEMKTRTLDEIYKEYLPNNIEITFLSIDIEGVDISVLKTNNFNNHRPKAILLEVLENRNIESILNNESIVLWLKNKGYIFTSKTVNTLFFIEETYFNKRFCK
ncbi:MAG: FkbM family methyltransferase [Campylobacterota bacterium]